jgi:hypothetical protein
MIVIERNVKMPESCHPRSEYYIAFANMDIGDSFIIPCDTNVRSTVRSLISSTAYWYFKKTGKRFICRMVEGGVRTWRTE